MRTAQKLLQQKLPGTSMFYNIILLSWGIRSWWFQGKSSLERPEYSSSEQKVSVVEVDWLVTDVKTDERLTWGTPVVIYIPRHQRPLSYIPVNFNYLISYLILHVSFIKETLLFIYLLLNVFIRILLFVSIILVLFTSIILVLFLPS